MAAHRPLRRRAGGADGGAGGGRAERRGALRRVAAARVPARCRVPAALPRGARGVGRAGSPRPSASSPSWCSPSAGPTSCSRRWPGRAPRSAPCCAAGRRLGTGSRCRTTPCRSCAAAASTRSPSATWPSTTTPPASCSSTAGPARARSTASWRRRCGAPRSPPSWPCSPTPAAARSTFGTREDWLIPSACLNSTVSGLVSRTVLNDRLIRPGMYHGAKFYAELAPADVSTDFLDAVAAQFDRRHRHPPAARPRSRLRRSRERRTHHGGVRHRRRQPRQARRR